MIIDVTDDILFIYYSSLLFFFKQKTAYEMRISDWSSDVCSSDLVRCASAKEAHAVLEGFSIPVVIKADGLAAGKGVIIAVTLIEIGRASCRERVCPYVSIPVGAVSLTKINEYTCSQDS